jgi:hypothetical protein
MTNPSNPPVKVNWFTDLRELSSCGIIGFSPPAGCVEMLDVHLGELLRKSPDNDNSHIGVLLTPAGSVWGEIFMQEGRKQYALIEVDTIEGYVAKRMKNRQLTSEPLMREMNIVSRNLKEHPGWLKGGPESVISGHIHYGGDIIQRS